MNRLAKCALAPAAKSDHQPVALDDGCNHDLHKILEHTSSMYSQRLLEHFQNPRNVGELAPPAVTAEVSNPACGDILRLSVRFEGDTAVEIRYKTRGCTASIAAGSALTEWMAGKTRSGLARITAAVIEEAIGGLEPESKHAAVLCVDAVRAVLKASGLTG